MKKKFKVLSARSYMKGDRAMVMLKGANDKEVVHLSLKQIQSQGYSNAVAIIGNDIEVEYYKKDEKMLNEAVCTKDETIVKSFAIEYSALDIQFAKAKNAGLNLTLS